MFNDFKNITTWQSRPQNNPFPKSGTNDLFNWRKYMFLTIRNSICHSRTHGGLFVLLLPLTFLNKNNDGSEGNRSLYCCLVKSSSYKPWQNEKSICIHCTLMFLSLILNPCKPKKRKKYYWKSALASNGIEMLQCCLFRVLVFCENLVTASVRV